MKKILPISIALIFSVSSIITLAQPPLENYYILTLKGSIVKNAINNSAFSFFDFTFSPHSTGKYILTGYAKDADGKQLGTLISLIPSTTHPARPFKNMQKGHLYLPRTTMNAQSVDGTEDYILTPKKCKDKSGQLVDYVSYRFSNKVSTETSFMPGSALKSFDLNPSPPY
ncbi:MAG: hypothetical protein JWR18_2424 [Segetibacter sp.]|nr:hypothetical protein [Segetibacter sp.]